MPEKVPDEILQRLDALAAKLGETGTHLWEVAVQYTWWRNLSGMCGLWILTLVFASISAGFSIWGTKSDNKVKAPDDAPDGMLAFLFGVAATVAFLIGVFAFSPGVFAPEGATLMKLMGK